MGLIDFDSFTGRTVSGSFGTSDSGSAWTGITDASVSVSSGKGRIAYVSGSAFFALLGSNKILDQDITVRITPGGSGDSIGVILRLVDSNNQYYARILSGVFYLHYVLAGVTNVITNTAFTLTAGQAYWIRARIQGSLIMAKIWTDGSDEPSTWTLSGSDSNITGAGKYGLYLANKTTGQTLQVDKYSVSSGSSSILLNSLSEISNSIGMHTCISLS